MDGMEQKAYLDQIVLLNTFGTLLKQEFQFPNICEMVASVVSHYDRDLSVVKDLSLKGDYPFKDFGKHEAVHPAIKYLFSIGSDLGSLDKILIDGAEYLMTELKLKQENVNKRDINEIQFYNAVSIFMNNGYPLVNSVKAVAQISSNEINRDNIYDGKIAIENDYQKIEGYVSLSGKLYDGLKRFPDLFTPKYVEMIKKTEIKPKTSDMDADLKLIKTLNGIVLYMVGERTGSSSHHAAIRMLTPRNRYCIE